MLMNGTTKEALPIYPNSLREQRQTAMVSRSQLSLRCAGLVEQDPTQYVTVSQSSLRDLENGQRKPRRNTANTLATALGINVDQLFPLGYDDAPRNPTGNTRIPEDRSRIGRPRKQ